MKFTFHHPSPLRGQPTPALRRLQKLSPNLWLAACLILIGIWQTPIAWSQTLTQSISLRPGWNAIWLEVSPTNSAPLAVFNGLPVASVWTWSERVTATDFIQNPATAGWNRNQWLGWFPTNSPEAALGNLYSIVAGRAYLVKVTGSTSVTLSVTGVVVPQPTTWSPNQYNLRGFPVAFSNPATFRRYFQYSAAFWDGGQDAPIGIYRLDAGGVWNAVSTDDEMERGQAYWVYVNGASDYPAPESLAPSTGDLINFSPLAAKARVTLANRTTESRTLVFSTVSAYSGACRVENVLNPAQPPTALNGYVMQLAPGQTATLSLYLDRSLIPSGNNQQVFEVNDQQGTLQYVGISFQGAGTLGAGGSLGGLGLNDSYPLAGLWIGTVSVNAVGDAQADNPAPPMAVPTPFSLRVLLHVDNSGLVKLLREVTMATLPASLTNSTTPTSTNVITLPGPTVLLTDPTLMNQYQARYRNNSGVTVRRLTALQFDDSASPAGVAMTGSFVTNGTLVANLFLAGGDVGNPFLHRYHPDHKAQNSFPISRQLVFSFTPIGSGVPQFGVNGIDGNYYETVTGLHKVPLRAAGTFTLQRVTDVGVLNPSLP